VVAALLLLGAVVVAYRIHVRWGAADQRAIELQSDEDIRGEIAEHEADLRERDQIAGKAAREQATRAAMN
jgi:hypothetical protein